MIIHRVCRVEEWEDIDVEDIWDRYGTGDEQSDGIWDSPNVMGRNRFMTRQELEEHPLTDPETGHENKIYTVYGYQIPRRYPLVDEDVPSLAPLLSLRHLGQLFAEADDDGADFYVPGTSANRAVTYDVYPLAGLRCAGHCQAHGIPGGFIPRIDKLNNMIHELREAEESGDEDSSDDSDIYEDNRPRRKQRNNAASPHPPVEGISFQGYNTASHYTRGRKVIHHEVQCGIVTGELAGTWATTNEGRKKAGTFNVKNRTTLPHERFELKLKNPSMETDLRVENVYVLDVRTLPSDWRHAP